MCGKSLKTFEMGYLLSGFDSARCDNEIATMLRYVKMAYEIACSKSLEQNDCIIFFHMKQKQMDSHRTRVQGSR